MRLLKKTPILLSFLAAALMLGAPASALKPLHKKASRHAVHPKPPVPPADTTKSAFAKLVVRNLGPRINGKTNDFSPTITADGKTMFFVSDSRSGGIGQEDFWTTESPNSTDTDWIAPVDVTEINSSAADGAASIAADGQTIYFASNRNTTVTNDVNIWVATLDGTHW